MFHINLLTAHIAHTPPVHAKRAAEATLFVTLGGVCCIVKATAP